MSLRNLPVPAEPEKVRPVRLAYWVGGVALVVSLYATFNAFVLAPMLATQTLPGAWRFLPLIFGALYLAGLLMILRGHFLGGRLALVGVASVQVLTFGRLIGIEAGAPFLALVPLMAGVLLFARTERPWMLLALGFGVASIGAMYAGVAGRKPVVELDPGFVPLARGLILLLTSGLVTGALIWNSRLVAQAQEALREEQERSEALLLNVLPEPVAERLKAGVNPLADGFEEVTVVFADLVGFTRFSADRDPAEVVSLLNEIFSVFDALAERHGVEKIKTIGDAYMVASGIPRPRTDHAEAAAEMALDMLEEVEKLRAKRELGVEVRIGLHCGPIVAGVIGRKKFAYDLWGDTVNVASRLEASGQPSRVHVSSDARRALGDAYAFEARGETELRGRDAIETFFLTGRAASAG